MEVPHVCSIFPPWKKERLSETMLWINEHISIQIILWFEYLSLRFMKENNFAKVVLDNCAGYFMHFYVSVLKFLICIPAAAEIQWSQPAWSRTWQNMC